MIPAPSRVTAASKVVKFPVSTTGKDTAPVCKSTSADTPRLPPAGQDWITGNDSHRPSSLRAGISIPTREDGRAATCVNVRLDTSYENTRQPTEESAGTIPRVDGVITTTVLPSGEMNGMVPICARQSLPERDIVSALAVSCSVPKLSP